MDMNSREDGLRRALSLAIPVGTQLGSVGLESVARATGLAAGLASWSFSSAIRTAGAGAQFVNRNVLSPLSSFAFGGSGTTPSGVRYCTAACPQLVPEQRYRPTRTEQRLQRVSSSLRSGSAKCSIRKQADQSTTQQQQRQRQKASAEQAPILIAHLASPCSVSSEFMHDTDDHHHFSHSAAPSPGGDVAVWAVNTLGLQSSML
ncbi:hypothetical protein HYH02_012125 [Chlamydomonas schloesseri]|uniref:Uncharacterized protein n=1 Tax=Chlamydomonas schloesseri TaxID=2026947 RepID=A0A835T0P5_9CHLO|nr:hypothetical protein HYH02_012125 [Chlamydomonas schloesseri]|eukprot:KAG2434927.1 hypothetical protein HYH02_012125 [Chlamydomonas schloesseri]